VSEQLKHVRSGPWTSEPDALDFTDEATGLPIALRRNRGGAWCGYIGVPNHHPWHGLDSDAKVDAPKELVERPVGMDDVGVINLFCASINSEPDANMYSIQLLVHCHGGLTYSRAAWWENETRATWWFGFDCSHSGDMSPAWMDRFGDSGDTYRTIDHAKDAAIRAARDINAAAMAKAVAP